MNKYKTQATIAMFFLVVVSGFCLFNLAKAQLESSPIVVPVEIELTVRVVGDTVEENKLGAYIASPTGLTDLNVTNDLVVDGQTTLTGTSTLDLWDLGTNYSEALVFTAGSTTTPGALFSIQNTGDTKLCNTLELDIVTGSSVGGATGGGTAFTFRVSTSTSATAWSDTSTLIASTTLATSSAIVLDGARNKGTGNATAGQSWRWGRGEYLNGAFDDATMSTDGTDYSTSSLAYVGMAGEVYMVCHTR